MSILDEPTLFLNRNWQVIDAFPVRTAIENAVRGQAWVVDVEDDYRLMTFEEWMDHEPKGARWIRTTTGRVPAPEVIVLKAYGKRPPQEIAFRKTNLARRDDWRCQYCGTELSEPEVTIDHVLPRSRGGKNSWENCVAACGSCNGAKADRTPQEAGMRLRKEPHKPAWKSGIRLPRAILPSWRHFLAKESVSA